MSDPTMEATYDEADELANAVQDALGEHAATYPGTTREGLAREAYDIVMRLLGHGEDDDG